MTRKSGGFAQLTTQTRERIETRIIRHWPDLGSRPIDLDAAHDLQTKDENWWGATLAELQKMRENLVNQTVTFGADREAA